MCLHISVYVFMHIYICRQTFIYVCLYIHKYIHAYKRHLYAGMHICIYGHRQTCMGIYACMYVHKYAYYMHTCMMHACMCMHICHMNASI